MFGEIAARSGRRARLTATYSDRADRLKPNIVFSNRDSFQRRGHLTVCKVAFVRLTLPRTSTRVSDDTKTIGNRDENVAKTKYSNPAVIGLQLRCFIIQPITVEHIVLVLVLVLVFTFVFVWSQTFRRFVIDPALVVVPEHSQNNTSPLECAIAFKHRRHGEATGRRRGPYAAGGGGGERQRRAERGVRRGRDMAGQLDQDDGERLEAVRGGAGHEHTRGFHDSRPTEPRVEATAAPPRLSFRAPRRRETVRQRPPSRVLSHSARCAMGPGPARRKCAARGGHR